MPRIEIDFRFVEIEYEFWALSEFLQIIDPQLNNLGNKEQRRRFAELREMGWDRDEGEVQVLSQELDEICERVLPRFFRGPFVIAVWAAYEAAVTEIARYLRQEKNLALELADIRGHDFITRARKYFTNVLATSLDPNEARLKRLAELLEVRNALAHGNGQRRATPENKWNRLKALMQSGTGLSENNGFLTLSSEFVSRALEDAKESAKDLICRVGGGPPVREVGEA